jgi:predicted dehydrogenase/threonine dehydrogenase-like Zn-dependent dehydrogenase
MEMIQAIVKKGKVLVEEVPAPVVSKGYVLIKVVNSCISAGTEISSVVSSGRSLIKTAIEQPERVKKVIDMAKLEGIERTIFKIKDKLNSGLPTGYSASGIVIAIGDGVKNFKVGDAVAAAGAGLANHAEYIDVSENLVVRIPDGLSFVDASTVALGSIAMQGVRRADLKLGEFCVVVGTGILGLLSIQILRLSGVRIIGIDLDERRLGIAKRHGAEVVINPLEEDPVKIVDNFTGGYGADAVLFTAATSSSEPLSQSFRMCKKKGRVILVGVVGMEIKREDMYEKELDFLISTSYGPGRYDRVYEEKGCDYPYAYVRWTENRNMSEYLHLLRIGAISLKEMIEAIYPIERIADAFELIKTSKNKPLLVIIEYGNAELERLLSYLNHDRKIVLYQAPKTDKKIVNIALVGVGEYATNILLPNIETLKNKYKIHAVLNRTGHKAKAIAQQYHAKYATTNYDDILNDREIDLVIICSRHDSHAELTLKALQANKNVYVEKPLATKIEELEKIKAFYEAVTENKPVLFVGFNRRFSKYAQEIKRHIVKRINPLVIYYRMNAGFIPPDHWAHESGGRIVGEACHLIDLMTFFADSKIESVSFESFTPANTKYSSSDNKSIILKYRDGSVATIGYFSVGNKDFPKEYMEIHFDGKTIVMDDYKSLKGYGIKINEITIPISRKGHLEELERLYDTVTGKNPSWPIEFWDMVQTTETTFLVKD